MIIPYPTVEVKHIQQVYVTSELKIKFFCFLTYASHNMNFYCCEKQIFKSSGCTEISAGFGSQNEPKPAETKYCNSQRPVFHCHVYNQALFDNPFTWAFQRWVSLFKYLQELKVAYQ